MLKFLLFWVFTEDYYDRLPQEKDFWLLLALQRILKMMVTSLVEVYGVDRRLEGITGVLWQAKVKLLEKNEEEKDVQTGENKDGMVTREGSPEQSGSFITLGAPHIKQEPGAPSSSHGLLDTTLFARTIKSEVDDGYQRVGDQDDDAASDVSNDSVERMIRQAKVSQEDNRRRAQLASEGDKEPASHGRRLYEAPKLYHTLVVCALGLLYLRAPILLPDLRRWVRNGQLPYMSAHAHLPERLLENLAGNQKKVLQARVCFSIH